MIPLSISERVDALKMAFVRAYGSQLAKRVNMLLVYTGRLPVV